MPSEHDEIVELTTQAERQREQVGRLEPGWYLSPEDGITIRERGTGRPIAVIVCRNGEEARVVARRIIEAVQA